MNDYQFDFIARALLEILATLVQLLEHHNSDDVEWDTYNELYDKHTEWFNKKEEENG